MKINQTTRGNFGTVFTVFKKENRLETLRFAIPF